MSEQGFRRVTFPLRDGIMAGLGFGDPSRAVDCVFLHANGFNARTYRALLAPLADRFHIVALDLRGHGRSLLPAPTAGYNSWRVHRDDLIAVLEQIGPAMLAGHSLGATTSVLAAAKRPDLTRGLALIDPVLLSRRTDYIFRVPGANLAMRRLFWLARSAVRRRDRFASRAEMQKALTGRGFFTTFTPDVLADYVADGAMDELDDGGVRLACAPMYEAATFAAQNNDAWRAWEEARGAISILRAEHGSSIGLSAIKRLTKLRSDMSVEIMPGATHALPMEYPQAASAWLSQRLASVS